MFEQHLPEPEAPALKEGDLFNGYEVSGWWNSKRVYQILAISGIVNVLGLVLLAQSNVLTARGCESPFVGRVCQVLDTVYVGTMLLGTEREYADMEYEKIELEDADITFIDVGGSNAPLTYPEGYFQIANPVQFAMQQQMANNPNAGFPIAGSSPPSYSPPPPASRGGVFDKPQQLPKSNPDAVSGDVTDGFATEGDDKQAGTTPSRKGPGKNRLNGNATPTPTPNTTAAAAEDQPKPDQFGVVINKRPLREFAEKVLTGVGSQSVRLDQTVKAVITGRLEKNADNVVVLKNPKPVRSKDDPKVDPEMEKLAFDAILAGTNSGWLGYLSKANVQAKDITVIVEQGEKDFTVKIVAVEKNDVDANLAASSLDNILKTGKLFAKDDALTFLNLASTTAEGKTVTLKVTGDKQLIQDMIQRKLAESRSKDDTMINTGVPAGTNTAKN